MKKFLLTLLSIFVVVNITTAKDVPFFWGGSGHLMAQNTVATNVFGGVQITPKIAIIGNYYANNVILIDGVFNGWVLSKGFSLDFNSKKEFLTILKTPKIRYFGEKWKIFAKIGVNFGGPVNKIHRSKISSLFGVGLRGN